MGRDCSRLFWALAAVRFFGCTAARIAAVKTEADVIKFAAGLEQGAANAYVGQLAAPQDHQIAHLFGQLATEEAVRWAILNNAGGGTVPKALFLFG